MSEPVSPALHVSGTRALSTYEREAVDVLPSDRKEKQTTLSFCLFDELARAYESPWLSYAQLDQGSQELCVACSFSQAAFAVALQKYPMLRTSI